MMDKKRYDETFVKAFTDFPLLVRTDTLKRLRAARGVPGLHSPLSAGRPVAARCRASPHEQYAKLGDYVVWDAKTKAPAGRHPRRGRASAWPTNGIDPALDGHVQGQAGRRHRRSKCATLWTLYQVHLKDYDLDTVAEITGAPKDLIERLAEDIATIKPVAIHQGEGINHWFHATETNRAAYLPLMLTGNIGKPGAGCHTWAGNYKAALFQGSPWTGPGFKGWVAEDPFELNLDPNAPRQGHPRPRLHQGRGAGLLEPRRPAADRRHPEVRPQVLHRQDPHAHADQGALFTNVNLINNAKWAYEHDQERQSQGRDDRLAGHRDDGVHRVRRPRPAGQLLARVRGPRGHRVAARTRSCRSGRAASRRSSTRKDDLDDPGRHRQGAGRGHRRPAVRATMFKFEHEGKRDVYLQRLLDTSHHDRRLQARRHHGRQVRPARAAR